MRRIAFALLTLACGVHVCAAQAPREERQTKTVSVDHLVRDVSAYLDKNPQSADAYSVLGRIHFMAYENGRTVLCVYAGNDKLPHLVAKGDVVLDLKVPPPPGTQRAEKPKDAKLSRAQRKEHLTEAARHFAKAVQLDGKNGRYHLLLADALLEFASKAEDLSPLTRPIEAKPDLSAERQREIEAHIDGLITDYVGARAMTWLVDHGDDAEPMLAQRLQVADEKARLRLQRTLAAHWKELAIEHYAQAHNLACKQDVASYNPAYGEPWDNFTALRAGKVYLQLTFDREDEETQRQAERVRETFAKLNKKIREHKGPVR